MDELEQLHPQVAELKKKAQETAQSKRQPVLDDVKSKIALYGFVFLQPQEVVRVKTLEVCQPWDFGLVGLKPWDRYL